MENLISLVNKIQRACTALGDYGEASALPTLWDSLPAIAVVGGQVVFSIIISSVIFYIPISTLFRLISSLISLYFIILDLTVSFWRYL